VEPCLVSESSRKQQLDESSHLLQQGPPDIPPLNRAVSARVSCCDCVIGGLAHVRSHGYTGHLDSVVLRLVVEFRSRSYRSSSPIRRIIVH
jgi:hypothetical protein